MKRRISQDERAEFEAAFKEARPIRKDILERAAETPAKRTPTPGGLDGNTQDRLRKGQLDPDARIDLHGMTETVAHDRLLAFLRNAQRGGARLALVITGKGAPTRDEHAAFDMEAERRARGVLKSMVPRWFSEPDFATLIADTRHAHRKHGGSGALYVYLRKRK
jgi:DNA-nicking Smr family endonuclease